MSLCGIAQNGMLMWWRDIARLNELVLADPRIRSGQSADAKVASNVELDTSYGPIAIGAGTVVCSGAIIRGPVIIGEDCLIGNNSVVRKATVIENYVRLGYCAEIKNSWIGAKSSIGPLCFVSDSVLEAEVYLGAMVRTSNERLDREPIIVAEQGCKVATGLTKLGCKIGRGSSLGIQVIILPGRLIAPGTIYEPRATVTRNLPPGRYRIAQNLELVK